MHKHKVLVSEFMGDFLHKLEEKSNESSYWKRCLDFVYENQSRVVMFLSEKQIKWLEKIKEELEEKK